MAWGCNRIGPGFGLWSLEVLPLYLKTYQLWLHVSSNSLCHFPVRYFLLNDIWITKINLSFFFFPHSSFSSSRQSLSIHVLPSSAEVFEIRYTLCGRIPQVFLKQIEKQWKGPMRNTSSSMLAPTRCTEYFMLSQVN